MAIHCYMACNYKLLLKMSQTCASSPYIPFYPYFMASLISFKLDYKLSFSFEILVSTVFST